MRIASRRALRVCLPGLGLCCFTFPILFAVGVYEYAKHSYETAELVDPHESPRPHTRPRPSESPAKTPNPSKDPDELLGWQERLVYWNPWWAGAFWPIMFLVGAGSLLLGCAAFAGFFLARSRS